MPPTCPRCNIKILKIKTANKDTQEGAETGRNLLEPVIIQNFILSDPSSLNTELLKKLIKAKKQTIVGLDDTKSTPEEDDEE